MAPYSRRAIDWIPDQVRNDRTVKLFLRPYTKNSIFYVSVIKNLVIIWLLEFGYW